MKAQKIRASFKSGGGWGGGGHLSAIQEFVCNLYSMSSVIHNFFRRGFHNVLNPLATALR